MTVHNRDTYGNESIGILFERVLYYFTKKNLDTLTRVGYIDLIISYLTVIYVSCKEWVSQYYSFYWLQDP